MEIACGSSYARAKQRSRSCSPEFGETFTLWVRRDGAGARGALSSDSQCVRLRVSDRSASGHRYLGDDAADSDPDTDGTIGWGTIELPSLATAKQFSVAVKLGAGAEKNAVDTRSCMRDGLAASASRPARGR